MYNTQFGMWPFEIKDRSSLVIRYMGSCEFSQYAVANSQKVVVYQFGFDRGCSKSSSLQTESGRSSEYQVCPDFRFSENSNEVGLQVAVLTLFLNFQTFKMEAAPSFETSGAIYGYQQRRRKSQKIRVLKQACKLDSVTIYDGRNGISRAKPLYMCLW